MAVSAAAVGFVIGREETVSGGNAVTKETSHQLFIVTSYICFAKKHQVSSLE